MAFQSNSKQQTQSNYKSIETLLDNQQQDYVMPRYNIVDQITSPIEDKYIPSKNEATTTLKSYKKNTEQTKKEIDNYTLSLSDSKTIALKAQSIQDKIATYKANLDVETNVNISDQNNKNSLEEYRILQEIQQKQNGIKIYQELMGTYI